MTTETANSKPARKRRSARAGTGYEALKKHMKGGNTAQDDVVPLRGDDLPVDDDVHDEAYSNRSVSDKSSDGVSDASSGATGEVQRVNSAPEKTASVAPKYEKEELREVDDRFKSFKSTVNYFIPARKIRDWEYNDRTQDAILADPKFPELKESIELAGKLAEAIVVRPLAKSDENGCEFEQVIGCKRLTACKLINPDFPVECSIQDLTDAEAAALQAAENKGRSDPPIWDRGQAWASLLDRGVYKSVRELAAALGEKHEKTVANYVRFAKSISAEPEFRSLPLSLVSQASLELLTKIAKGQDYSPDERDEIVQRIVEIEDDIRKRPERAVKLIEKILGAYNGASGESLTAKPKVYQSEHGKTMTLSRKNDEFKVTLHSDIANEIDHDEVESLILDYLKDKGLHVKEKSAAK